MIAKSHNMNVELHSRIELHSDVELHNEVEAHYDSEISVHRKDLELPEKDVHSNFEAKKQNEETRAKPRLSKYIKRHHPATLIIGD